MSKIGIVVAWAVAMGALACDESDGGGPIGNTTGDVPGESGAGKVAGRDAGGTDGGDPDAEGADCAGRSPSEAPFGCPPMRIAIPVAACEAVVACGGFLLARSFGRLAEIICGYRPDGTLAWAQRCSDTPVHCGMLCMTSAGAPTPVPSCPLPSPCDGGRDGSSF